MTVFDQAALTQAVTDALNLNTTIPADKQGAFVTLVDDTGVRAVLAHRLEPGGSWLVSGYVDHPWQGSLAVGVSLQAVW